MYGLKQAPRLWYKDTDEFLRSLGFIQSHADPNVYIHGKANTRMLLLLYVDDISLAYPRTVAAAAAAIKAKLAAKYKITNLGAAQQFLGIQIFHGSDDGHSTSIALG